MDLPLHALPDDVDALKAMVLAMACEQAAKEAQLKAAEAEIVWLEGVEKSANERIANLTSIMKVLQRTQYGRRSEQLRLGINDEQVSFAFEEVETGLSAIRSELDVGDLGKPKRASRPRKVFAAHLERIEEIIEPEIPAGYEGLEKVLIGEDRSERLDVVPPKFRGIVTRRPKYALRNHDGVVQALAPAHIIESGLPTERLLAYIAVSKYADGLPLYRQEAIYLRDGVTMSRSLWRNGWGIWAMSFRYALIISLSGSKKVKGSSLTRRPCPLWLQDRARPPRHGFGLMRAMIALMVGAVRQWWLTASKTAEVQSAWRGILPALTASCRSTDTLPIRV